MAQERVTNESTYDEAERLIMHAYDDAWWRKLIAIIHDRQRSYMRTLVFGSKNEVALTKAQENILRGQIGELDWLLTLDEVAGRMRKEKNNGSH